MGERKWRKRRGMTPRRRSKQVYDLNRPRYSAAREMLRQGRMMRHEQLSHELQILNLAMDRLYDSFVRDFALKHCEVI